jgi:imidazole glycerol phosphate synthase subunit HisF
MTGLDLNRIKQLSMLTNLPLIISGGASCLDDFKNAALAGASAVAAGALFQFTQITPYQVNKYLSIQGILVRQV